jgi:hypothetical protein
LGPAQCYSTDPVSFRQPRRLPTTHRMTAHRAGAIPTALSRPCQRAFDADAACRCCFHVPSMQPAISPSLAMHQSSPPFFIPPSAHPRTAAAESTVAPLRSVTPHPKPTTVLPAEPSTGAIDLSSGRSPTAPLCPSCRECLHTHRCLRLTLFCLRPQAARELVAVELDRIAALSTYNVYPSPVRPHHVSPMRHSLPCCWARAIIGRAPHSHCPSAVSPAHHRAVVAAQHTCQPVS